MFYYISKLVHSRDTDIYIYIYMYFFIFTEKHFSFVIPKKISLKVNGLIQDSGAKNIRMQESPLCINNMK